MVTTTNALHIHSGMHGAELGPNGPTGLLSQTIATSAGQSYLLSLWLFSDGQAFNLFNVSWNGANIFNQTNIPAVGWTNLQFTVTATSNSTVLQFEFEDDPSYLGLDDIVLINTNTTPQRPVVSKIAAGGASTAHGFSLFLLSNGALWGSGFNGSGELGDGTNDTVNIPKKVVANSVTAISAGGNFSLFLKNDGSLWGMGDNSFGQLGNGTYNPTNLPEKIVASNVTAVAAGDNFSLFLMSDGSLWGMGDNRSGQLGDGSYNSTNLPEKIVAGNVTAMAAGDDFSLFLKSDGSLWGMGGNDSGQLGVGSLNRTNLPVEIVSSNVTAIAAKDSVSLFVKSDGSLWVMGWNGSGQLGDGTFNDAHFPEKIAASNVKAVAEGSEFSLFLKNDGSLWGMGDNFFNQLGGAGGGFNPVQVVVSNVTDIAAGYGFGLFTKGDGTLWGMGNNGDGELGQGIYTNQPIRVFPYPSVVAFTASPTNGAEPLTVQFNSPGTDTEDLTIVGWNWKFGDGSSSSAQNPSHTYTAGGIFQPSLVATNIFGDAVQSFGPAISVTVPPIQFTANPTSGLNALTVLFSAPSVDAANHQIVSWNWHFGDGFSSSSQNPSHTYNTSGNFQPTLVAMNNIGETIQSSGPSINVQPCTPPPSSTPAIYDGQAEGSDGLHLFFHAEVGFATLPATFQWTVTGSHVITYQSDGNGNLNVTVDRTSDFESVNVSVAVANHCGSGSGTGGVNACGTCLTRGAPNFLPGTGSSTSGPLETNDCGHVSANARWFGMKAEAPGLVTVSAIGVSKLNQLAVYTGPDIFTLTYVTCASNSLRATFTATSNNVYWFAVDPGTSPNLGLTYGFEPMIQSFGVSNGMAVLQSTVAPPIGYRILASTNLSLNPANWSEVLITNWDTNTPYLNYRIRFQDTNTFRQRFYRLAPAQ